MYLEAAEKPARGLIVGGDEIPHFTSRKRQLHIVYYRITARHSLQRSELYSHKIYILEQVLQDHLIVAANVESQHPHLWFRHRG